MEDKINISLLQRILVENQEAVQKIELSERELALEAKGNYIFVGPRQAGKTFCLFQIIKQYIKKYSAKKMLLISLDEEKTIEFKGEKIECFPIWKWVLGI